MCFMRISKQKKGRFRSNIFFMKRENSPLFKFWFHSINDGLRHQNFQEAKAILDHVLNNAAGLGVKGSKIVSREMTIILLSKDISSSQQGFNLGGFFPDVGQVILLE